MTRKKHFTVTLPPLLFWIYMAIFIFFAILLTIEIITSENPTAAVIIVSLFILLPCLIVMLWARSFKVEVNGSVIKVRKGLGLIHRSFDVADITLVQAELADSKLGRIQSLILYRAGRKAVSVGTTMPGFEKFRKYITENVDESKFQQVYRSPRKR